MLRYFLFHFTHNSLCFLRVWGVRSLSHICFRLFGGLSILPTQIGDLLEF